MVAVPAVAAMLPAGVQPAELTPVAKVMPMEVELAEEQPFVKEVAVL